MIVDTRREIADPEEIHALPMSKTITRRCLAVELQESHDWTHWSQKVYWVPGTACGCAAWWGTDKTQKYYQSHCHTVAGPLIAKADELPVHNRKGLGNQKEKGGGAS